ncbi:NAD(P)-dependent alcohol dehydrogenase [Geminicoccus flavidas]|uniref:NAD(P)-dependent alcohol dehydrogenase n=1 Tax=Geminicoccus flavidas TaxID=2506407 RepID=UPI001356A1EE|nr:NAD(P)-dependent alcohol dehydrogenase [Geminicoccus flavidas]
MVKALVLEEKLKLNLRDIEVDEQLGPRDVRIQMKTVGVCGSDVHYYTHGGIGQFIVREPMILGHEASGVVIETGSEVTHLKVGDRVCMEPGIPDPNSRASRLGMYNLDPRVVFWATPPVHGCLRPTLVFPADYTFKIPDNVSFEEAAMVEPLAVGVHGTVKARVMPGDSAVVIGAGPIGLVTVLAAFAAGCAKVYVADIDPGKLAIAEKLAKVPGSVVGVDVRSQRIEDVVMADTDGWGADIVFECSGNEKAAAGVFKPLRPGGCVVFIGMPLHDVAYDVPGAALKEARVEHVFRYAHVYPRCIAMMASGAIDVKPLITDKFPFEKSVEAFEYAATSPKGSVKIQIDMPG